MAMYSTKTQAQLIHKGNLQKTIEELIAETNRVYIKTHGFTKFAGTGAARWFVEMNNMKAARTVTNWCYESQLKFKSQVGLNRIFFYNEEDLLAAMMRFESAQ